VGYSQIQRSPSDASYLHDQLATSALSRFEARVQQHPERVALIFQSERLTFGELNARANQLAHYLKTLDVAPETYVAICLERSLAMVVGILGILKAGGVYVPLDPRYPRDRTLFMLEDANARILITQESLAAICHEHAEQVICLDSDWTRTVSQFSNENLSNQIDGYNLAYIIYTSGSSGLPKGVMITHNCLSHYLKSMKDALGITASDVYLHTASFAFSSSVRQLMLPLAHGAAVTIASTEQILNPLLLFAQIKQQHVTVMDVVPSYWRNLTHVLAALPGEERSELIDNDLRLIVSASEALLSDVPATWSTELKPELTLRNMYGQTETTGIVSTYLIANADTTNNPVISIGTPITNMQFHILDDFEPVSDGGTGQLYVSGPGLGRGYLNQPALTAERFIPNPFSDVAGDRLYTTGDLARYLPTGDAAYVGRADEQVKVRGYRVELREIEATLTQHPAVCEAVVLARGETGEQRLVGYVVAQDDVTVGELNNHLRVRLPEYMVPSTIMMLDEFPLTANGKVDRRALPAPDHRSLRTTIEYFAPRNRTEDMLASIFADVLQLRSVGIHDNFFELGGQSLLGMQILSRVRESVGVELVLQTFFEAPTVAQLCERIDAAKNTGVELMPERIPRIAGEE